MNDDEEKNKHEKNDESNLNHMNGDGATTVNRESSEIKKPEENEKLIPQQYDSNTNVPTPTLFFYLFLLTKKLKKELMQFMLIINPIDCYQVRFFSKN